MTIPESLISIGDGAFWDCSGLTSVTIPESVTSIGERAFYGCSRLISVTALMTTPVEINGSVFSNISNATLYVPRGSKSAYENAAYWKDFKEIVEIIEEDENHIIFVDENVKSLCVANWDTDGNGMLSYEEAASVTSLGTVFENKKDITMFDELQYFTGLTAIGGRAFYGCRNLISVTIPNSVTSIDDYAFSDCSSLTSMIIPPSVVSIGGSAFSGCSCLTSVMIPNSVTSIGDNAFNNCDNMTAVRISDLTAWCSISFSSYSSNPLTYAHHLYFNNAEVTELIIPTNVISIANYAFEFCSGLTSVMIPNSVISIGDGAYRDCSGLTSVSIPNSVTSIGKEAFCNCSSLTSMTIPESVTAIDDNSFYGCSGLTSVTIPNSVTSIGKYAFYGCSGLTSMTIPENVISIGAFAFCGCNSLTSVTVGMTTPISIEANTFTNRQNATLYVPSGCRNSYVSAAYWNEFKDIFVDGIENDENFISFIDDNVRRLCVANWDTDGNGMLSYEEAAAVTDLGSVFEDNADITSFDELQYFTSLTTIGDNAFFGCSKLASITLPENIVSIGDYAFASCKALTTFTIPANVSEIGSNAFRACTGLTDVYCLPQEVPTTASNAFYNANIGNATLHVVVSSYNAYKAAMPWKNFKNMLGDIPAPCAVPVISYVEGKLVFTSETEGVKFNSSITCEDIANREDCSEIDLCVTYLVSVYATKEGYTPSETVTATLCWIDAEPVEGVVTDILEIAATPILVQNEGGTITVTGVGNGQAVSVYNLSGQQMGSATGRDGKAVVSTSMHSGEVAIVKIGQKAVKVRLR